MIVFFSRSGNTEVMARKIAQLTGADVLPLQSARNTNADIKPNQVDLSAYDTVYIGSPVWLYSPALQEIQKNKYQ